MKRLFYWITLLAAFAGTAALAQDITGTWQGTLSVGNGLRTVLKIAKADGGALKATFYSIDQGGQPIPVSSMTQEGSTVKFAITAIGGNYEGKLSADGHTITGNWSQGPNPLPLNLSKATPATEWAIPEPPPVVPPMAVDAKPGFEVATVKPSNPDAQGKGFMVQGRHIRTVNTNLDDLLSFAYGIHAKQIVGAPDWAATQKFDIDGEPDQPGRPNHEQVKSLMVGLLAERFQLKFHHEKKELPVYALVATEKGAKLTKSQGDPSGLPRLMFRGLGDLPVANATLEEFCGVMQAAVLDRPVVDQTGIKGRYDFTLTWTPDESQFGAMGVKVPPPSDKPDAPPGLFAAIQEELGLKLEATKAPVDVLVIDHVEKPSAN